MYSTREQSVVSRHVDGGPGGNSILSLPQTCSSLKVFHRQLYHLAGATEITYLLLCVEIECALAVEAKVTEGASLDTRRCHVSQERNSVK